MRPRRVSSAVILPVICCHLCGFLDIHTSSSRSATGRNVRPEKLHSTAASWACRISLDQQASKSDCEVQLKVGAVIVVGVAVRADGEKNLGAVGRKGDGARCGCAAFQRSRCTTALATARSLISALLLDLPLLNDNDSYCENHIKKSYRVVVHEPENRSCGFLCS